MASTVPQSNLIESDRTECSTRSLSNVRFSATGSFAPSEIVRNADLARLGCDEKWIIQRTGIRERRHAPEGMATGDMAFEAGRRCLENADLDPSQVDLLLLATMTPDYFTPATSCLVQKRLGMKCAAMDLNAACSGFLFGMITGAQYVQSGCANHVLVIGADVMSRVANPNDVKTFPLFGDGAGALLLTRASETAPEHEAVHDSVHGASLVERNAMGPRGGILSYVIGSDGDTEGWLRIPGGGYRERLSTESLAAKRQFLIMDGRPVFKWAVRMIAEAILEAMGRANLGPDDISLVMLHQANIRIIEAAVSDLGFPRENVFVNLDRYGNTSAGSIPLALDEANREGRLRRGDKVLFCGFGSGLSWGACVVEW